MVARQFDICLLRGSKSQSSKVIILQHDRFDGFKTRIVAPLISVEMVQPTSKINPLIVVEDKKHLIAFNQISTVPISLIGSIIVSAKDQQSEFISAIDMMFVGY